MLPAAGWLVLGFRVDNPGAWLMHCHIAWHVSGGLSVQFLELPNEIPNIMKLEVLDHTCKAWGSFMKKMETWPQIDSGL